MEEQQASRLSVAGIGLSPIGLCARDTVKQDRGALRLEDKARSLAPRCRGKIARFDRSGAVSECLQQTDSGVRGICFVLAAIMCAHSYVEPQKEIRGARDLECFKVSAAWFSYSFQWDSACCSPCFLLRGRGFSVPLAIHLRC